MTAQLIFISFLYILIWLVSIVTIQGLIKNSLSVYDKLYLIATASLTIILIVTTTGR